MGWQNYINGKLKNVLTTLYMMFSSKIVFLLMGTRMKFLTYRETGAIALWYPPFFIDDSGAEFHAD